MLFLNLYIKIISKNKKQLKLFLMFLKFYKLKFKLRLKIHSALIIKLKKTNLSVLKSPHVHKTSQEHFKIESYSTILYISHILQLKKFILLFKYFHNIFMDLVFKLQFEFFFKNKLLFNKPNNYFNPNKFFLINYQFLNNYIKLFDIYGEVNLIYYV